MVAGRRFGMEVRAAQASDAAELARLLGQAGIQVAAVDAAARLEAFRGRGAVLVATDYEGLSGLAAVSWSASLLHERLVAQLSALVVDADERRLGIGRMLLKAVSQAARAAGCDILEVATSVDQPEAEPFLSAAGFRPGNAMVTRSLRRHKSE